MFSRPLLALALLVFAGCSTPDPVPPQCPASTTPATDRGECSSEQPQATTGQQSGAWTPTALHARVPLTIADPSGGLVEVTLTVTDVPGEVGVTVPGDPDYRSGVLAWVDEQPPRKTRRFTFRAQGQQTYELDVAAFSTPGAGESAAWTVSWRYTPNPDCYEPNDTLAAAKRIPLDVPITAFAHPGIRPGEVVLVRNGLLDFYRFELSAPTTVRLAVKQPYEAQVSFELWDGAANAPLAATDLFAAPDVVSTSAEVELAAGTWYVRVSPFVDDYGATPDDQPAPAYWSLPYTLTVERVGVVVSAGAAPSGGKAVCLPTVPGPATRDDECVRYTPDAVQGQHRGLLTASAPAMKLPFGANDLGGGLFRFVLTANGPVETVVRRRGGVEELPSGRLITDWGVVGTHTLVFRAQGFEGYELEVASFVTLSGADQVEYQLQWTYEPVVDCYERNDTVAQARRIPLGRFTSAFSHAGVIEGDTFSVGPSLTDVYKVVLDAPKKVRLAARKPNDVALSFELIDATGAVQAAISPVGDPLVELQSDEVSLAAGTWFVRVTAFVGQPPVISGETVVVPDDWTRPYTVGVFPSP